MTSYFDSDDRQYTRLYKSETPDILSAFNDFNSAVFAPENREIPLKYRELIAVAVAITTQCAYCIDGHSANAVKAGATRAELAEAAWVAAALKAGGAFAHGRLALKLTDEQFKVAEAEHQHTVESVH
jgi:AhpD family alkylhydroperoxidase